MIKINKKKLFILIFLFFSFFVISARINSSYANYKWNITLQAICQTPSKVLKPETKIRMFRILWPWVNPETGQYSPWDFNCRVDSEEGNNSSTHFMEILSENPLNNTQGIYVGLELPVRDNKKAACSEGVAFEPYEITPSVPNICRNIPPSGDYICFGKYFKPYNFMAKWSFDRLTPGNYTIKVRIPDEYCTDKELPPPSNMCPTKTIGDANCDGKIDGIDYSMWLNRWCEKNECDDDELKADFNNDGIVDDIDYKIWFDNRLRIPIIPTRSWPIIIPTRMPIEILNNLQ